MSRLEEVEAVLDGLSPAYTTNLCIALAAEVDELTADRDSETRWACQYKAERDELQRRLNEVVGECCGTRDVCARTITAIAEGRDNG